MALVGARASTAYGEHVAAELGHQLGERGWTVVSGGALGIDTVADLQDEAFVTYPADTGSVVDGAVVRQGSFPPA